MFEITIETQNGRIKKPLSEFRGMEQVKRIKDWAIMMKFSDGEIGLYVFEDEIQGCQTEVDAISYINNLNEGYTAYLGDE